jgi:putative proteasome-type protease
MTYCLSLLTCDGFVCFSDSRTNAGVDNITVQPKMRLYSKSGERVLCLTTSGNLSLTQTLIALIEEDILRGKENADHRHILNQPTMFETARYVGEIIRRVSDMDRKALEADGLRFNINVLLSGQIAGQEHQIYRIYSPGNSIHASMASPFLQIGEFKYGKPILDRGFRYETTLQDAIKFGLLSLETTMKSNVSVGTPFDVFCYEKDSLEIRHQIRLQEEDIFLRNLRQKWQEGLVELVGKMPGIGFPEMNESPSETRAP